MKEIIVNDTYKIPGEFTFTASYDNSDGMPLVDIAGVFITSAPYISFSITSLTSDMYDVRGVRITKEMYHSEEEDIAYQFVAKSYTIAPKKLGTDAPPPFDKVGDAPHG